MEVNNGLTTFYVMLHVIIVAHTHTRKDRFKSYGSGICVMDDDGRNAKILIELILSKT